MNTGRDVELCGVRVRISPSFYWCQVILLVNKDSSVINWPEVTVMSWLEIGLASTHIQLDFMPSCHSLVIG